MGKRITIDFRKYPERAEITANVHLSDLQTEALTQLPPEVDILNLDVELDGHHIIINKATSQYYNPQTHKLSNEIPMTSDEINDMLYHSSHWNIHEFLTNRIED